MSTPPPPMSAPASAPLSPEPAQPRLSEGERMIDTFIAPRKTFEDIRVNSSWWKAWLLSAVITLGFGIIAGQKVDFVRFMEQQIERSATAQKRMEQVPPEQRDRVIAIQATVTKIGFYAYPVVILVGGIVFAAILMAIFNFMLGAQVPFSRALAVVFYSFLPWNLFSILLGVSLLVSSDPNSIDLSNPMPTNAAFFMDPQSNKFLYGLVKGVDIFWIWAAVLLGLGFAVASSNRKPSVKTGIITVAVAFVILVLIGAGWRAAFA